MTAKELVWVALMAALICIAAPLAVPVGAIPITLATFAVYLAGALLGMKRGALAVAVYLLLGLAGLPVFSGFNGGVAPLAGPTGGYLIGYLPCAAAAGFVVERGGARRWTVPAGMIVGTAACYALGTAWFMFQSDTPLAGALAACVLPFLPGDAIKIAAASALAFVLRVRLPLPRRG